MELEDLLSDELLEWLGNYEPDVSDDTDIEQLLAAASDVYEQSQSTGSTPQPDSAPPAGTPSTSSSLPSPDELLPSMHPFCPSKNRRRDSA